MNNIDTNLLDLLNELLDTKTSYDGKGNQSFYCPLCETMHYKEKLVVMLDKDSERFTQWNCWVCNKGKGKSIVGLFKLLQASADQFNRLKNILKNNKNTDINKLFNNATINKDNINISLPIEYYPLWINKKTPQFRAALNYIKNVRHLNNYDILKYQIGYCEDGEYRNKIIIPSFDFNGKLNYFVSRNFYTKGYKNPNFSKDIIFNELLINWNQPIILVEGVFDAMTIKKNVIPLLGIHIQKSLMKKILKYKPKVYICLDNDAESHSLNYVTKFRSEGINSVIVKLPYNKDPSELGYTEMIKYIYKSSKKNYNSDINIFKDKLFSKFGG